MPKKYCVIGSPITHSLSPAIHNALYERYDLDCTYKKFEVTGQTLAGFIETIPQNKICGFNVTMPLKQAVLPYLSHIADNAKTSVNTVAVKDGALYGYSTDAKGFYRALRNIGADYTGANIVFLGAGGVTRLLCADALSKGGNVTLLNRSKDKAKSFAEEFSIPHDTLDNLRHYMKDCTLLINTTPLGMSGIKENFKNLDFLDLLPQNAVVSDLIYSPPETEFLRRARERGLATMNGLGMLIWQAFYSFEIWFGILPDDRDYNAVLQRLQ